MIYKCILHMELEMLASMVLGVLDVLGVCVQYVL